MEQHQILHLNDTADYRLGSLVSSFGRRVVYVDILLILLPLVSAVKCLHRLSALSQFSCAGKVVACSGLINNLTVIYNASNIPSNPESCFSISALILSLSFPSSFASSLPWTAFYISPSLLHNISFQSFSSNPHFQTPLSHFKRIWWASVPWDQTNDDTAALVKVICIHCDALNTLTRSG